MAHGVKELQRAELHRTVRQGVNDFRDPADSRGSKSYELDTLFYRFFSENLTSYINRGKPDAGMPSFSFAHLSHEAVDFTPQKIDTKKRFLIKLSERVNNVRKQALWDKNPNETLDAIFLDAKRSAVDSEGENLLKGLFYAIADEELVEIVLTENLKPEETTKFVEAAFRNCALRTTGTAITKAIPPISRFSKDKNHSVKKQRVIQLVGEFFEHFFGRSTGSDPQWVTALAIRKSSSGEKEHD